MKIVSHAFCFAVACLLLMLGACGGGGDEGSGAGTPSAGAVIGAAGGTVVGPNGAKVEIPPGALAADTTITIEQTSAGAPALLTGIESFGTMFAFTPHGTTFAVPVTITLPFDPASVPVGKAPALFKTNTQNQWTQVTNATFGADTVSVQVTGFSWWQLHGLRIFDPTRVWSFGLFPANGGDETRLDGDTQVGGVLDEIAAFGPADFDEPVIRTAESLPPDGVANGLVFSTANGMTYGVSAEAPDGAIGGPKPIGSASRLTQTQSFIKIADDATLSFTVTAVIVELQDFNFELAPSLAVTAMKGEALLAISAIKNGVTFFHTSGRAGIYGARGFFIPRAADESFSRSHLWSREEDFDFVTENVTYSIGVGPTTGVCHGTRVALTFKHPRTYTIDLSSLNRLDEFTLKTDAHAETLNGRGGNAKEDCGASSIRVYLRDPIEVGGSTLAFSGLEPTNRPEPTPPVEVLVPPAACVPGPGPNAAAGVLQFDAASYTVDEFAPSPTITVTRTGGSSGAVTATFSTSDGSAIGGTDYTPLNSTVFFADGDAGPKVVSLPIIRDQVDEIDKTVNLTLSQPGGCAALGAQTTAVLTIRDDDARPALPSGLDATFGTAGLATLERFGGDRSGMALQADGKIVMVGGTFADFILARFNADGSIDRSFGIDGKVTTDMGSGLRQEEALAVAIQSDGKIVVAGHTAIDATPPARDPSPTFALARYNSDGSLDTTFGSGGKVSDNVNGQAYAVAIQVDGKIVVAGEFSFDSANGSDFSDFTVARFNPNGTLDLAFGGSGTGQVATDIGSATNSARNLVLQPNGAIVVSGKPQGNQVGFDHTDVARYNANGTLDSSFGSGGKLTLAGVDVGQGLARQPDGKFVLAGSAAVGSSTRFALMRLNADGGTDSSFGSAGTVNTAFAVNAAAAGVALQGDGKIVAVGTTVLAVNPDFVVARYNADGSIDTGFGSDGNLSIDFGFTDIGESVLVQPDGKIVVGGQARDNFDGYGLARINP